MTPRAVRPARARKCAAGLSEARLAVCITCGVDTLCIPVTTSVAGRQTLTITGIRIAESLSLSGREISHAGILVSPGIEIDVYFPGGKQVWNGSGAGATIASILLTISPGSGMVTTAPLSGLSGGRGLCCAVGVRSARTGR